MQLWFGPGVRSIVEGETRFSKIGNFKEAAPGEAIDLKALDLQQLFLAMTEEVHAPSGHANLLRQSASLHAAAPNLLACSLPLILVPDVDSMHLATTPLPGRARPPRGLQHQPCSSNN